MSAFPAKVTKLIDFRDSDLGELLPYVRCQACGRVDRPEFCSRQHRIARGAGGSKRPLLSSAVVGVTMCGSATTPGACHSRAEARDPELYDRGFWRWSTEPIELIPIQLWDGRTVWPTLDGRWIQEAPAVIT